jgi:hypothetical protein
MRKLRTEDRGAEVVTDVADSPLSRHENAESTDYASIGSHVASVLEAATEAAGRLRDEATVEATRIREAAEREAATKISDASNEASRIAHEAEGLRTAAEEAANRTTERAEAFARKKRNDAEAAATDVLRNAETVATRQHVEMITREKALHESVDLAEKRLQHLVTGLRDLAGRLETVLNAETLERWNESTLDEVLKESVRGE